MARKHVVREAYVWTDKDAVFEGDTLKDRDIILNFNIMSDYYAIIDVDILSDAASCPYLRSAAHLRLVPDTSPRADASILGDFSSRVYEYVLHLSPPNHSI